jgi:hypothetical protein
MLDQNVAVVHPVKQVAAQNDIVIDRTFEKVAEVLPECVCGSLLPMRSQGRLLCRQNFDEAWREIVELVGVVDMLVQ